MEYRAHSFNLKVWRRRMWARMPKDR